METKRYLDKSSLETWIIKCNDYKELNEVMIPVNFEVIWLLAKGDFPYAKFHIKTIVYDKPYKLKA